MFIGRGVQPQNLWDFVLQCSQLTSLKMFLITSDTSEIQELSIPEDSRGRVASMRELELYVLNVDFSAEAFLDWIGNGLEVLNLSGGGMGCYSPLPRALTELLSFSAGTLKTLKINSLDFTGYEDDEIDELYEFSMKTRIDLPNLQMLSLKNVREIYPLFYNLNCPDLRSLKLAGSMECQESLKCLINLVDSCKWSLVELHFSVGTWKRLEEARSVNLVFHRLETLKLGGQPDDGGHAEWFSDHSFPKLVNLEVEGKSGERFILKGAAPMLK